MAITSRRSSTRRRRAAFRAAGEREEVGSVVPGRSPGLLLKQAREKPETMAAGAVQTLQRTIGNRATTRLLQRKPAHRASPQRIAGGGSHIIQRALHPKSQRALQAAEQRSPGFLNIPLPGGQQGDVLQMISNSVRFTPKIQKELIHLWTKGQKRRRGNDQELTARLDYARAFLLKQVMVKYYDIYLEYMLQITPENKDAISDIIFNMAVTETSALRDKLVGFGLAKAGAVAPELGNFFNDMNVPTSDQTQVQQLGPRIEIRGTTIPYSEFPGKWHSFIVYTDALGQQQYVAAHAAGAGDNEGQLWATTGPYVPGIHEWQPTKDVKVLEEGDTAADNWGRIVNAANGINQANIRYHTMSKNCNRAAYHILRTAGVARVSPPGGGYVGWGKMLF